MSQRKDLVKTSAKSNLQYEIKLLILEEDNAIMRKEISLLKSKLKLPESDCLLTEEEKEDCIRSAHNALQSTMGSKRLSSETSTEDETRYSNGNNTFSPDCIGSYSEDRSDEQEFDTAHAPSDKLNDSVYIPCATHWAASQCTRNPPPAHTSQSVSANCEEMRSSCGYQHFHGNNSAQGHHDHYQVYPPYAQQPREVYSSPAAKHAHAPADLSMKQVKSSAPSSDLAVMRSESTWHSPPNHTDNQNSTGNGSLHNENEHLKTKLFQLAAQVEEMKNMIMKR